MATNQANTAGVALHVRSANAMPPATPLGSGAKLRVGALTTVSIYTPIPTLAWSSGIAHRLLVITGRERKNRTEEARLRGTDVRGRTERGGRRLLALRRQERMRLPLVTTARTCGRVNVNVFERCTRSDLVKRCSGKNQQRIHVSVHALYCQLIWLQCQLLRLLIRLTITLACRHLTWSPYLHVHVQCEYIDMYGNKMLS